VKCLFDLLIAPLSYSFEGHFKNNYPPINLEFRPLEVMKPSFLASEPFSTYTLIRLWCRSMSKTFLITFFKLLFLKNCVMSSGLWRTLSLLPNYFMALIFFFIINMGGGHHYYQWFSFPRRCSGCFGHFVLMCSLLTSLSHMNNIFLFFLLISFGEFWW